MSSTKRSVWAVVGKVLWAIVSLVLRVIAGLGSRWARKKLDEHRTRANAGPVGRVLHRKRT